MGSDICAKICFVTVSLGLAFVIGCQASLDAKFSLDDKKKDSSSTDPHGEADPTLEKNDGSNDSVSENNSEQNKDQTKEKGKDTEPIGELPVPPAKPPVPAVTFPGGDALLANGPLMINADTTNATSIQWSQVSGPGIVSFSASQQEDTSVSADVDGTYVLRLTAGNAAGQTIGDVTLDWDTTPPVVDAGTDRISGITFNPGATVSGGSSYLWTKNSGPGVVTFSSTSTVNTDISADQDGTYVIRLTSTDDAGNAAFDELTLTWDTTVIGAFSITGPASPVGTPTPTVTWEAATGATKYDLVVAGDNACTSPQQTHSDISATSKTLTAITGTVYICVTAKDNATATRDAVNTGWQITYVDPWFRGSGTAPAGRGSPTTVYTGSRVIVWGGNVKEHRLNSGALYDPATGTWSNMTLSNSPSERIAPGAWLTNRFIVWGGDGSQNDGKMYDPVSDTWTTMNSAGAPSGRANHTLTATDSEIFIWGGGSYLNSGARFNPATNTWSAVSTTGAPPGRTYHRTVWTGNKVIVWGGHTASSTPTNSGGVYDPVTDSWVPMSTVNAPSARYDHLAVWTGSEMIVFGGYDSAWVNTGAKYNPATDTWTAITTVNAPGGTSGIGVWTGSKMVAFHYQGGDTAVYDPVLDTWTTATNVGKPGSRASPGVTWTGSKMFVWGGYQNGSGNKFQNDGALYDPDVDNWTPVSEGGLLSSRFDASAVYTGSDMIVWGGYHTGTIYYNTGGKYNPVTKIWTPITVTGAPQERFRHLAVWTGSKMIVWGGQKQGTRLQTGGVYNPAADSWTATTTTNAPTARELFASVWTGSKLIVWGGFAPSYSNSGGVYDPDTDSWTATSTTGAPTARAYPKAVWTGTEMIVWGGFDGSTQLNTGGRYNPATDTWTAVTNVGAPDGRGADFTAVWTGTKMIIFGGYYSTRRNTGGVYDPATDTWTPTTTTGAPSARGQHVAFWTGTRMLVWSGDTASFTNSRTGGFYDPDTDSWAPTPTTTALVGRSGAAAVWTGTSMLIFGGTHGFPMNTFGSFTP